MRREDVETQERGTRTRGHNEHLIFALIPRRVLHSKETLRVPKYTHPHRNGLWSRESASSHSRYPHPRVPCPASQFPGPRFTFSHSLLHCYGREKKGSSREKPKETGLSRMENVGTFVYVLLESLEVFFFSRFNQNDQKISLPHAFLTLFPFSLMKHAVVSA